MENLVIEAGKSTPEIDFNWNSGLLYISGLSYPENAAKFYAPIMEWITLYLDITTKAVILNININYLNTSSSKVFINIFDLMEKHYKNGRNISVKWLYDPENDISIEWGEEFKENLEVPFSLEAVSI